MSEKEKKNFYCLDMFPYPSGSGLHVGHPRGYTATDVYSRYKKLQGFNVLHPVGWDAFGLPAENYAIANKIHPSKVVSQNVEKFKDQLNKFDLSYDWDKEINTTDPKYYRWTQFIFLKLFERGLAYEADAPINFCPSCKTGLANEEVIGGKCERCGTEVERKNIRQWMLKITDYADRLLEDLDGLDWPAPIKEMQKNWIGRSEGSNIKFNINNNANYLLLHGFTGSAKSNFFPWLKKYLEDQGHKVEAPELPDTNNPNIMDQVSYVLANCKIDTDTIILGHSLGAVVALKIMEKIDHPIKKLILAAGFIEPHFEDHKRSFSKSIDWKFNLEKIKKNVGEVVYLQDINDTIIPKDQPLKIKELLNAKVISFEANEEHICGKEEPKILDVIDEKIEVYTTRTDTLFGCTWLVLAPENQLVEKLKAQSSNVKEVEEYIEKSKKKSDLERTELSKEKTGVELAGIKAINPINGKEIPIWIADYVLAHYGTGAVMAVPAHDQRDFEFATKYNLEIIQTIAPKATYYKTPPKDGLPNVERNAVEIIIYDPKKDKYLCLKWKKQPWTTFITGGVNEGEDYLEAAKREVLEETGYKNIKLIKSLGRTHAVFHAAHKNENRIANGEGFLFELVDDEQNEMSSEEQEIHEIVWLDRKDLVKETIVCASLDYWLRGVDNKDTAIEDYGYLVNSNGFDGLSSEEAQKKITEKLKESGHGNFAVNYKLRDWVFSRQRYWGEPIPIVHCAKCGIVPVPESDLPVLLPHVEKYEPTGDGTSPLSNESDPAIAKWLNTKCPKCGGPAKRETNTMPQWAGSCWYYIAYLIKNDGDYKWERDRIDAWLPVDLYVGGAEHAVLHLLYARFWHKVLYDEKLVGTKEPFQRLISVGTILGIDGQKMSKSRGNVISPDPLLEKYGSDALKMYELYIGPFSQMAKWNQNGIVGMHRFLQKVEKLSDVTITDDNDKNLPAVNKAIKKVSEDIEGFNFNTAISTLIETFNQISKNGWDKVSAEAFLTLLSPFAPKATSKLAEKLSIAISSWPVFDEKSISNEKITIAIQVNGKVRDEIGILPDESEENIKKMALGSEKVKSWIKDSKIKKFIYIKGKIVSIVV